MAPATKETKNPNNKNSIVKLIIIVTVILLIYKIVSSCKDKEKDTFVTNDSKIVRKNKKQIRSDTGVSDWSQKDLENTVNLLNQKLGTA